MNRKHLFIALSLLTGGLVYLALRKKPANAPETVTTDDGSVAVTFGPVETVGKGNTEPPADGVALDAPAETQTYRVAPGDTLGAIATRYGTTAEYLGQLNGLPDINRINAGQTLLVPV